MHPHRDTHTQEKEKEKKKGERYKYDSNKTSSLVWNKNNAKLILWKGRKYQTLRLDNPSPSPQTPKEKQKCVGYQREKITQKKTFGLKEEL